jgi:NAD(P)H-dependent flavin oxidoreductase YrpB (nitropropane dioxygenase family)
MKTEICKTLGIETPIFAFSHCRDVVVAVSKAGGLGVLGAVSYTPEELKEALDWIDANIGDKPYGVDVIIPEKYEGMGEMNPEELEDQLRGMIPKEHMEFASQLLADHHVPEWTDDATRRGLLGWTEATAVPMVEEAIGRKNCKIVVNALGTPPVPMIEKIHRAGKLVGALCGKPRQALAHKEAGVDLIIAQGSEGGGHTGEISSLVLWPQIVEAVAPLPVLAAGGIANGRQMVAAMAMGVQGVWTGTIWLTVEEAEASSAEKQVYFEAESGDAIRSRAWTGKPARCVKNAWTEAWARADTPEPLGMPLQGLVSIDAIQRTHHYPEKGQAQKVTFHPAGQVVGQLKYVKSCRTQIYDLLNEYAETMESLSELLATE